MKIGLALGSGGAKGLAHIGVIQELQKAGIRIDYIAGTSIGALIGGLVALGKEPKELEEKAILHAEQSKKELIKKTISSESLYSYEYIHKKIYELYKDTTFADTKIPFYALATDLIEGKKVVLDSGKLLDAVEASSRIPLYYPPKKIGNKALVDGAVTCPVPIGALKRKCDFIIAIALPIYNVKNHPHHFLKMMNVVDRSISILIDKLVHTEINCEKPDFILEMNELAKYSTFDFENAKEIIEIGKLSMRRRLPKLLEQIRKKERELKKKKDKKEI